MEIERKWLTFGWPEGLEAAAVIRMEQGYIATRPTVRIRLEERGEQVRRVLCFKGKAGPDGLAREEIETDVTPELFQRLERLIGRPLIWKEQRRYALAGGLTLEVNHVDPGQPEAFFYAEVEFPDLEAARSWQPGPLAAYLDQEVTGTPGESMAAYWERTRGVGAEKNAL